MDNYNHSSNSNYQNQQEETYQPIKPKKKSWFKRKKKLVIWGAIILVVIFIIVGAIIGGGKQPEYVTHIIEKGDLKQSVDATGKIESAETIELNFKTTGRIQEILVKPGDEIEVGQTLARLNAGALQSQVANAQAQLNQAQADYDKTIAGSSVESIKIAEDTVEQKNQALVSAQNDLVNLELTRDTKLLNSKENALTNLSNEILTAKNALEEIDNTLNDADAEDTLSIKNPVYLNQALENQADAESLVNSSETEINSLSLLSTDQKILTALDNLTATLNQIATTLDNVLTALGATLISADLTETELDALKTNIKAQQTKISTSKTTLQTAKSSWTYDIVYYQNQITSAEDTVSQAQKALAITISQLNLEKSPPRQFEIDLAQAKIAQMQANLNLAIVNLNDAIITAPVEGTITKRNLEPGEYASLSTPTLEMIGISSLQIEVDIPESDIAKISLGQNVEITLDAFTEDDNFAGKVTFIDPAETIISDVVYYKVKIQFDELSKILQDKIKPGMTANVVICTNLKENVLFVPARAVKSDNGDKYVEIVKSRRGKKVELEKKKVTTGMRGDEGIEITSGLNQGEEVVTFVKE